MEKASTPRGRELKYFLNKALLNKGLFALPPLPSLPPHEIMTQLGALWDPRIASRAVLCAGAWVAGACVDASRRRAERPQGAEQMARQYVAPSARVGRAEGRGGRGGSCWKPPQKWNWGRGDCWRSPCRVTHFPFLWGLNKWNCGTPPPPFCLR